MGTLIELFPTRVSGETTMFVRRDGAWHMLSRHRGKLERRRFVPYDYATALIETYSCVGPTDHARAKLPAAAAACEA